MVVGTLGKLDTLTLRNTRVTDAGLAALSETEGLKFLALEGCAVSAAAVGALRDRFPDASIRADE